MTFASPLEQPLMWPHGCSGAPPALARHQLLNALYEAKCKMYDAHLFAVKAGLTKKWAGNSWQLFNDVERAFLDERKWHEEQKKPKEITSFEYL